MTDHRFDNLDWCVGCGCSRLHAVDTQSACTERTGIIPALYLANRRRSQPIIKMADQILRELHFDTKNVSQPVAE